MISFILLMLGASRSLAFPDLIQMRDVAQPGCQTSKLCDKYIQVSNASAGIPSTPNAATKLSASRTNCGYVGRCNEFDATQQYVSTVGEHAFIAPTKNDVSCNNPLRETNNGNKMQVRGPCPGLNAAANHNYIPRNGILNIQQASDGLYEAYGLEQQLGAFLAAYAVIASGYLDTLLWSIGGPPPTSIIGGPSGSGLEGLSYSHNWYEGDTSLTRCDACTNNGDAHAASVTRFRYAYESGMAANRYTLDVFSRLFAQNTVRSIETNRCYFVPFVMTGFLPGWYNFAINFMSNHSAAEPAGYLDGSMLEDFFAMNGTYPNFHWMPGQERIPNNWYRRPNENTYGSANFIEDLLVEFLAYPDTFRFGGNVNKVNTYVPINIANITDGAYSNKTILQGDNFACLFLLNLQETVEIVSESQDGGVNGPAEAIALFNQYTPSYFKNLTCPEEKSYYLGVYQNYYGDQYHPTPPYKGPQNC